MYQACFMTFSPAKTTVAASHLSASSRRSEDVKMLRVALFTERGCMVSVENILGTTKFVLFFDFGDRVVELAPHHI